MSPPLSEFEGHVALAVLIAKLLNEGGTAKTKVRGLGKGMYGGSPWSLQQLQRSNHRPQCQYAAAAAGDQGTPPSPNIKLTGDALDSNTTEDGDMFGNSFIDDTVRVEYTMVEGLPKPVAVVHHGRSCRAQQKVRRPPFAPIGC